MPGAPAAPGHGCEGCGVSGAVLWRHSSAGAQRHTPAQRCTGALGSACTWSWSPVWGEETVTRVEGVKRIHTALASIINKDDKQHK